MSTNFTDKLNQLLKERTSIELIGLISMISLELLKKVIVEEEKNEKNK